MGWFRRKKSTYFEHYNRLATELAERIGCDPFWLQIPTQVAPLGDIDDEQDRKALAARVGEFWHGLKSVYQKHGITQNPQVFIKNNSGTYGLSVTHVSHPDELLQWSWRQRKKLKAAKGGRAVTEVILQEGIPTQWRWEEHSAEPVLYFVGSELVGHFLRSHNEKSEWESLNAPGSRFIPRPLESLSSHPETLWIGRLAVLALAYEIQADTAS
jgi:glutamate--cysteine ligase